MSKPTGGKRGAPFGNKNRLKHGAYSAASMAARREARALLQETRLIAAWANAVDQLRKAKRAGIDLGKLGFSFAED
jgi:hypothetical protein